MISITFGDIPNERLMSSLSVNIKNVQYMFIQTNSDIRIFFYTDVLLNIKVSEIKLSPGVIRVYGQFCIETLHERHNGIQRLVVCLSEYLPLSTVSL